ncbi:hypothetical protein A6C57_27835 (plasmid) [Fibrella sp. ES10-3-2-2]
MEYDQELIAIDCLNALFWNYSRDDINALKSGSSAFAYVWDTYIADKQGEKSFNELWHCWMVKFNLTTKTLLLDHALARYRAEKQEALQSARVMSRFLDNQNEE